MPRPKKTVKAPKVKKPKRIVLTKREENLLEHPPTPSTWICSNAKHPDIKTVNPGSAKECYICLKNKPANPKLVWPEYVAACAKVNIEPSSGAWKFYGQYKQEALFFPKGGERWEKIDLYPIVPEKVSD